MAYNEDLAERVRRELSQVPDVLEKQMFGGLTFMVNNKMCVGVVHNDLMCRIDPSNHTAAIKLPGARTMDMMKGREIMGYVFVDKVGLRSEKSFKYWINLALEYNKKAKAAKKKR